MINFTISEYYQDFWTLKKEANLKSYIQQKRRRDKRLNYILIAFILSLSFGLIGISKPISARGDTGGENQVIKENKSVYLQKNFEENIRNKYAGSFIDFPAKGCAHIKKVKYINSKPVKINIVEINTKVNPNLKIKPQIAGEKLNSKTTVRKIAQKEEALVAINGGFFKPRTGTPLGALMIDGNVLTGSIYNRVGIAIFDEGDDLSFKMDNINFDISIQTDDDIITIDNINQPRMLSTYTLIYTSDWAISSPIAPKGGYNALIRDNKIIKISANPIEISNDDVVISAPVSIIKKIAKSNEIKINIKLAPELSNARHIIGAGPYLVKNSQIYVDYKTEKLQAISAKNPRSAIGFDDRGTFIIVSVDGREEASVGMTLYELANLMKDLGCEFAMNFDGGSSSALYVKGKIVNSAVNKEGIAVSNALIVSEIDNNELQLSSL